MVTPFFRIRTSQQQSPLQKICNFNGLLHALKIIRKTHKLSIYFSNYFPQFQLSSVKAKSPEARFADHNYILQVTFVIASPGLKL